MSFVVALSAVSSLLLVGAGALVLFCPSFGLRSHLEWLPLSFAAGSVVAANWGLVQVVVAHTLHPVWLVVLAVGILAWRARSCRLGGIKLKPLDRWHLAALALGLFAATRLGVEFAASMDKDMGWDGLFIWGMKAKMLLMPEIAYFTDRWLLYTHPDYPLLLPSLEAWTYHWAGLEDLRAAKWISPFSLGLSALVVYLGLRRLRGPASSALLAFMVLVPAPAILYASQSYADLSVGMFFTGAIVYGCLYVRAPDQSRFGPVALFLLAALLTKKEGQLLALALAAGFAVSLFAAERRYLPGVALELSLLSLAGFVPWLAFLFFVGPPSSDFVGVNLGTLTQAVHRAPEIAGRVRAELGSVEKWGATWLASPIALALFPRRILRRDVVFILVSLVLAMAMYSATYGFTTWPSVAAHMNASVDRLLLQLAPAAVFAAGVVSAPSAPKSTP